MRVAGEAPQSAVAGCRLDPSNKQTTLQKSGYQWRHTTRSGRRKGSPHSQSFPTSAFPRRVMSQSALRDHPSGSSFDTDLDSRMGMKRIQPSDDFDQRKHLIHGLDIEAGLLAGWRSFHGSRIS